MTPRELAEGLAASLRPVCERVELAGSLRRGKSEVGDLDVLCIPIQVPALRLFDEGELARYDLNLWLQDETDWELDRARTVNGPRWKRLIHPKSRLRADLFITRPEAWGIMLALRTGPADFSKALVMLAEDKGLQVEDGQLWRTHRDPGIKRTIIPTPTEEKLFLELGLAYIAPRERSVRALRLAQGK